jgi:hypothetical protein
MSRSRHGYNEDQLARFLGVTREVMRGWAKLDSDFAAALSLALMTARDFWQDMDDEVRRREQRSFLKQHNARYKAERKAELDAMSPDERKEEAKARRKAKRDEARKPPVITKEQLRAHQRKQAALTKAEREQDDAVWGNATGVPGS